MYKGFEDFLKDVQAGDVHIPTALPGKTKKPPVDDDSVDKFSLAFQISKTDDEQQIVWGWASVIEENGQTIFDHQDDGITELELVKGAHDFVENCRIGGEMHSLMGTGHIVESLVFTKELQAQLGIDLKKIGWLIGYKVTDPTTWGLVKSGVLKAFSIGGRGKRVPV